jgi:ABC-type multidrug transport system ATPase subunit
MSESILKAIIRLFAIIAGLEEQSEGSRHVVFSFLNQQLNEDAANKYIEYFDELLAKEKNIEDSTQKRKRTSAHSVKVLGICDQLNTELTQKQKIIVLLRLEEIIFEDGNVSEVEIDFVETVASSFNIPDEEYLVIRELVTKSFDDLDSKSILVCTKSHLKINSCKTKIVEGLNGAFVVLHLPSVNQYVVKYNGKTELYLNGQPIVVGKLYLLNPGASVRSKKTSPLYFSDFEKFFLRQAENEEIVFEVKDLEFQFKSGRVGIHPLSFTEKSGELIGIMGGSGAGKSTLLNVLNGNEIPTSGSVKINGFDLHEQQDKLQGVIGYVPQDDLLIESLTVFQNLYYNARLCLENKTHDEIKAKVKEVLAQLGLQETSDLKVGNSLDKTISGGQRKRLNIALELIREPAILFLDEPTSGLSSRDSEVIMDILKGLALRGKLIFIVLHQPSSDIFKLFDKLLLLDTGGYPIYYGNPVESLIYFKNTVNHINANESECVTCGTVNPEQVFSIVEANVLDEYGNVTPHRKISPKQWNKHFLEKIASKTTLQEDFNFTKKALIFLNVPSKIEQIKIFFKRDLYSKISNLQYLYITLLEAPVLAAILAFIIKYYSSTKNGEYIFRENPNLPAYIFMCVIVSLFLGMSVSAEEIFADRKILKREKFLDLSRFSYIASKVGLMFSISALQTLLFVLVGNSILEINGMFFTYWTVLFSVSCFANLLGLNISAAFKSAVTIYILIPFLLIPQLLLAGVIVKFENLHPVLSSSSRVPATGNIMCSRWAFEALAVEQFKNNAFEKPIFEWNRKINYGNYIQNYWADAILEKQEEIEANIETEKNKKIIVSELKLKSVDAGFSNKLTTQNFRTNEVKVEVEKIKNYYSKIARTASEQKEQLLKKFVSDSIKRHEYKLLQQKNENEALTLMLRNSQEVNKIQEENERLFPHYDQIYLKSNENGFSSHFYTPQKSFFGLELNTLVFNVSVIWAMSLLLILMLYYNILEKFLNLFESRKK